MVRNDEEITELIINNCKTKFPEELIKKLKTNSQTSRLSTKYEIIEKAIIENFNNRKINYTQEQVDIDTSRAYIYAKIISGRFLDIRPRTDSTQAIEYIIANYEEGYKYMLEALFMKLSINSISSYVKGKIEGNTFFTRISGVTNSQPSEIRKSINQNTIELNKIKNLLFEIRAKEDELRWIDSRIQRKSFQNESTSKKYNLNFAQ